MIKPLALRPPMPQQALGRALPPAADTQAPVVRDLAAGDELLAQQFLQSLSPLSYQRRFHARLPALGARLLAAGAAGLQGLQAPRAALVAVARHPGRALMVADARYVGDGNGREAECAIVVADPWRRCGLGRHLMLALQQRASEQGLRRLRAEVQTDNSPMLALLMALGWHMTRLDETRGQALLETRLRG